MACKYTYKFFIHSNFFNLLALKLQSLNLHLFCNTSLGEVDWKHGETFYVPMVSI